jgi:hypothetical protein
MYSRVSMEFRRHGIPSTQNSAFFLLPYIQYAMLYYLFHPNSDGILYIKLCGIPWNFAEFCGILRILRANLYNMYEFECFKCKFVMKKSKISRLVEVEPASFFIVC